MARHHVDGPPAWTSRVVSAFSIALSLCVAGAVAQDKALTINDKE
jgi:hypothetical protein